MKRILCVGAVWGDRTATKYGISRERWFMAWSHRGQVAIAVGPLGPTFHWHATCVPRFPLGPSRADQSGFPL